MEKDNILRDAQMRMLEILIEVDRVCRKNNIKYWLDSGTLLGAVRHGGFIPWDDDIDICMMESDYKHFLKVAPKDLDKDKYFLHCKYTDKNMALNSAKVRDRNSLFVEDSETEQEKQHQGIYIDIFPMIYLKNINKFSLFMFGIINKTKDLNPYAGNNKHKKLILKYSGCIWLANKLSKIFFSEWKTDLIGYRHLYKKCHNLQDIFPLREITFEGYVFLCPNNYDKYLKNIYDDYMHLPPESEREWHAKKIYLDKKCFFERELERTGKQLYEHID